MSGFNRLLDLFRREDDLPLPDSLARHKGWGRVNQWMDTDAEKLAAALRDAGCNATLCEFLGFGRDSRWNDMARLYEKANDFTAAMRHKGVWVHWTIVNWNIGEGLPENGRTSICEARFSDAWFADIVAILRDLSELHGNVSILPCAELGVRNSKCRAKGLRWHGTALAAFGPALTRWNGNGDASPASVPHGEVLEYHVARVSDTGYPARSLVVTDTSMVLNELGGLHGFVTNHDKLRTCVRQARARQSGFVHYGFDTPGIDYKAIETIGAA